MPNKTKTPTRCRRGHRLNEKNLRVVVNRYRRSGKVRKYKTRLCLACRRDIHKKGSVAGTKRDLRRAR